MGSNAASRHTFQTPAEDPQCASPATSQRIRGTVRRTHSLLTTPDLSALDRLARYKPRYLLHGVIAAVSVVALSSIALHPRPLPMPRR